MLRSNLPDKTLYSIFAFLEGATVMAIQLIAANMLIPFFGSSLFAWGATAGITLLSLALGYLIGGVLTQKDIGKSSLYWTVLLSSMYILLTPTISNYTLPNLVEFDPIAGIIIGSIAILLPSILFLGIVPSFLIQFWTKTDNEPGKATGTIYFISTLGAISSVILTGFVIIPHFGVTLPTVILGLIPGSVAFLLLITKSKVFSLAFFIPLVIAFSSLKHENQVSSQVKLLYHSEGLLGQVIVSDITEFEQTNRLLFVNRMGQTGVNLNTGRSISHYIDYIIAVASVLPLNSEVLLLGLGGGTLANQLEGKLMHKVDAVEFDARIAEVAKRFFSLSNNVHVIIDDARHFIEKTNKKYQLIVFDLWKGENVPSHALSLESFTKAKSILNPDGMIIVNFNGFKVGNAGDGGRSLYQTIKAAGYIVHILSTGKEEKYSNHLFIGTLSNSTDLSAINYPLTEKNMPIDIQTKFLDTDKFDPNHSAVLTDDKPILEYYNISAARIWRDEYTKSYTRYFLKDGTPLFK